MTTPPPAVVGHGGGMVTAAHREAAVAGTQMLEQDGTAVDAAVAAAFALTVVDPANTGVGGYGGFMVIHTPPSDAAHVVDFNTDVPAGFDVDAVLAGERAGGLVAGGAAVSVPRVVPGLVEAQRRFGRLPLRDVVEPAIRLAHEGFTVGLDLSRGLDSAARDRRLPPVFVRAGRPLRAGDRLVQRDLAATLREVAARGAEPFTAGPLVQAMCDAARAAGGTLSIGDFGRTPIQVGRAERTMFAGHAIFGPPRRVSGAGLLFDALAAVQGRDTGANGSIDYVAALGAGLRLAWRDRLDEASVLFGAEANTTHACAADSDGMLVAVTHTHGLTWLGSGIVAPGTGILLNAGANSFALASRTRVVFPMTNMTPVIVTSPSGARFAAGTPGGQRIPAIVLQAIVDVIRYGMTLHEALQRPRVAVGPDGRLEVEASLMEVVAGDAREISASDFYGPANGIVAGAGLTAALDRRFACAAASTARRGAPGDSAGRPGARPDKSQ